jgi:hypothetical protein
MFGSASRMRRRTSARVSARQPPRDWIRSSMRREAACPGARFASATAATRSKSESSLTAAFPLLLFPDCLKFSQKGTGQGGQSPAPESRCNLPIAGGPYQSWAEITIIAYYCNGGSLPQADSGAPMRVTGGTLRLDAIAFVLSNRKRPFHLFTDGKLGRKTLYLARFCPILVEA